MRRLALFVALSFALFLSWSSNASALTGQLTAGACPGNPGAASVLNVDCGADSVIVAYATFATSHDISDLELLDATLRLTLTGSDLDLSPFWNLDYLSPCADNTNAGRPVIGVDRARPAVGCTGVTDTWVGAGGSASNAYRVGPSSILIGLTCFRTSPLAVLAQQPLFGFQLVIETVNAVERGGTCAGCGARATIDWETAAARSRTGNDDEYGCTFNCAPPLGTLVLNDLPVPTQRRSWGQLKSLYR